MNIEKILKKLNVAPEHKGKIEEINKYVTDHRVQELFNVSFYRLMLIGNLDEHSLVETTQL